MHVGRLQEGQDMIEMLRVAQAHNFAMAEAPEPKRWSRKIVAEKDAFLCAIVVSCVNNVWVLTRQMIRDNEPKTCLSRLRS